MTSTRAVSPAAGWTHKLDPEEKQDHEFSNLLQEFLYAVQRHDGMLMEYCACELKRMFRARRPQKKGQRQSSSPARGALIGLVSGAGSWVAILVLIRFLRM